MSDIMFPCTGCGTTLKVSNPALAGKQLKCPKCGAVGVIPAATASTAAAPPRPPAGATAKPAATSPAGAARPALASTLGRLAGQNWDVTSMVIAGAAAAYLTTFALAWGGVFGPRTEVAGPVAAAPAAPAPAPAPVVPATPAKKPFRMDTRRTSFVTGDFDPFDTGFHNPAFGPPGHQPWAKSAPEGGKTEVLTGQVQLGVHEVNMKADVLYFLKVEAKGPRFYVDMRPDRLNDWDDRYDQKVVRKYCLPAKDVMNTITVLPSDSSKGKGPFDYALELTAITLAVKPLVDVKAALEPADPPYKENFRDDKRHKAYPVKVETGETYAIHLKADEPSKLFVHLLLVDDKGKTVRMGNADQDGSRIVFAAAAAGNYRVIVASAFGEGLGGFRLNVRVAEKK